MVDPCSYKLSCSWFFSVRSPVYRADILARYVDGVILFWFSSQATVPLMIELFEWSQKYWAFFFVVFFQCELHVFSLFEAFGRQIPAEKRTCASAPICPLWTCTIPLYSLTVMLEQNIARRYIELYMKVLWRRRFCYRNYLLFCQCSRVVWTVHYDHLERAEREDIHDLISSPKGCDLSLCCYQSNLGSPTWTCYH